MLVLLAGAELFHGLEAHALDAVLREASIRRVGAGETLLKQGEDSSHLFMVAAGRFKMTVLSHDGVQTTLRYMEAGDVIGCAAVFRGIPYPATATAAVDSAALAWPQTRFDALVRIQSQLAVNALALVGGRAEAMLQRLQSVATEGVEQRLARALLRLHHTGAPSREQGEPTVRLSRQDLAELADTTIYTVSRVISAWTRAGLIASGRGRIAVRDRGGLARLAEYGPASERNITGA